MTKKKGFTLVELLVVIAILAVILLIATPIILNNINSSKEKSYNNQILSFKESAKRYALEYDKDIIWDTVKVGGVEYKKAYITLRELANKRYVDLPVMNPMTGEEFDPNNTKVTIYGYGDGNFEFSFEGIGSFQIINNTSTQYILKETSYDYMNDIYVVDSSGENITSTVTIDTTCMYNGEAVECDVLKNSTKELGSYYITYKVSKGEVSSVATRTVVVVEQQSPIITVRPDTENKVDNVRVFIEYPADSKDNKYISSRTGTNNYKGAFDVDRNQKITATCRDKYGLACKSVEKEISNIKPTIEGNISIAVDWPNTTSFDIDISGVNVVKGDGTLEYKCKVGNTVVDWNSSNTCNISGLTSGQAYTVEVYVRDSKEKDYVIETKPTIYTSKVVAQSNSTSLGTCPSSTNVVVSGDTTYPSVTLSGSCSQTYSTAVVSSTITNSTACGAGATLTYSYSGNNYSSSATSSCDVTSSKCNSSTSYYACSKSSYSASGCSSLSYYACSRSSYSASGCTTKSYYSCTSGSYSASGCSTRTTVSVPNPAYSSYSACINSRTAYCASFASTNCNGTQIVSSQTTCYNSTYNGCMGANANVCGTAPATSSASTSTSYYACTVTVSSTCSTNSYSGCSVLINSASGCSTTVKFGCSVLINSTSGCSQLKYSGCSVLINSTSGCSKDVCNGYTSYYTTKYSANIKYPSSYTISYNSVIIKPKQSLYN